ncbi:hypothetical protein BDA96_03G233600 [Sorghum bicolor]|uniref:Uncharacterized protein n=1 Tax=Sorghum bicolor TaxID=4558 RepID=A0A921UN87_SORBI|nr:hypothetical protein BDA96_03G233600 [Sorghum bicolor]
MNRAPLLSPRPAPIASTPSPRPSTVVPESPRSSLCGAAPSPLTLLLCIANRHCRPSSRFTRNIGTPDTRDRWLMESGVGRVGASLEIRRMPIGCASEHRAERMLVGKQVCAVWRSGSGPTDARWQVGTVWFSCNFWLDAISSRVFFLSEFSEDATRLRFLL